MRAIGSLLAVVFAGACFNEADPVAPAATSTSDGGATSTDGDSDVTSDGSLTGSAGGETDETTSVVDETAAGTAGNCVDATPSLLPRPADVVIGIDPVLPDPKAVQAQVSAALNLITGRPNFANVALLTGSGYDFTGMVCEQDGCEAPRCPPVPRSVHFNGVLQPMPGMPFSIFGTPPSYDCIFRPELNDLPPPRQNVVHITGEMMAAPAAVDAWANTLAAGQLAYHAVCPGCDPEQGPPSAIADLALANAGVSRDLSEEESVAEVVIWAGLPRAHCGWFVDAPDGFTGDDLEITFAGTFAGREPAVMERIASLDACSNSGEPGAPLEWVLATDIGSGDQLVVLCNAACDTVQFEPLEFISIQHRFCS